MGSPDDGVSPPGDVAAQPGPAAAPVQDGTRIGAATLAAAGEVGRHHAQRLAEHRRIAWPAAEQPPANGDDSRA